MTSRVVKSCLLDEVMAVTGWSRDNASRRLSRAVRPRVVRARSGRPAGRGSFPRRRFPFWNACGRSVGDHAGSIWRWPRLPSWWRERTMGNWSCACPSKNTSCIRDQRRPEAPAGTKTAFTHIEGAALADFLGAQRFALSGGHPSWERQPRKPDLDRAGRRPCPLFEIFVGFR
jgi:hypothetical protein